MKQLDLKIIKLLMSRDVWTTYGKSISRKILSSEVKGILKTIDHLHTARKEDTDLTVDEVYHMYASSQTITIARLELIKEILNQVEKIEAMSPSATLEIISHLHEKEAARTIADKALAIVQRSEGALSLSQLKDYVNEIDTDKEADKLSLCPTDIQSIKDIKANKGVFKFTNGLEELERDIPALSRGHLCIVFASTNAGKSSFVAQTCTGYLQQGFKVLYFGNEDPAHDIILNFIKSAENKTDSEVMYGETEQWDNIRDKFSMVEAHSMSIEEIEDVIKEIRPDVVVYDQLDNVPVTNKLDKRHEALESLYQRVRQLGATYDILNIAVSQANDEATGKLRLRSNMMANSRIGKGGTADVIIGIGMQNVDTFQRSICICKNKVSGSHETLYMVLDPTRCRYEK